MSMKWWKAVVFVGTWSGFVQHDEPAAWQHYKTSKKIFAILWESRKLTWMERYSEEKSKILLTKWLIKPTIEVSNSCLFCVKHCKYIYLIPAGYMLLFQVLKAEPWGTERFGKSRQVTQLADPSARPSLLLWLQSLCSFLIWKEENRLWAQGRWSGHVQGKTNDQVCARSVFSCPINGSWNQFDGSLIGI